MKNRTAMLNEVLSSVQYAKTCISLRKYASVLDYDDVIGIFNEGMLEALQKVKKIGNPKAYLLHRGYIKVQQAVRMELNHRVIEECAVCNRVRPYRQEKCNCGSSFFVLHPRVVSIREDVFGNPVQFRGIHPEDMYMSRRKETIHILGLIEMPCEIKKKNIKRREKR